MDTPCKVKTFMRRACSEALPTKKNLQKRKALDNPVCSQCSKGEENAIHALWECETIHCIWDQSFGEVRSDFPRVASFLDLVSLTTETGTICSGGVVDLVQKEQAPM